MTYRQNILCFAVNKSVTNFAFSIAVRVQKLLRDWQTIGASQHQVDNTDSKNTYCVWYCSVLPNIGGLI